MVVNINQIIINTLSEDRVIQHTSKSETYIVKPEAGKMLRNKKTGQTFSTTVSLGSKTRLSDFEEIDMILDDVNP